MVKDGIKEVVLIATRRIVCCPKGSNARSRRLTAVHEAVLGDVGKHVRYRFDGSVLVCSICSDHAKRSPHRMRYCYTQRSRVRRNPPKKDPTRCSICSGTYKKVTISKDDTVILEGAGEKKSIEEKLVKIGGASETEVGEKKDRVTDALNAMKPDVEDRVEV